MSAIFVTGLIAGYGVAIPVGAIAALLVSLTARTSLRVGAAAALGVATADGLYAALAVAGGAALSHAVGLVATPLRWASGLVLLGLAGWTAWTALRRHRDRSGVPARGRGLDSPGRAYPVLLGLTLLNPVTIVYFAALVLGGQAGTNSAAAWSGALFVLAAFLASASWQLALAAGGALIGRLLTGPLGRLATGLFSALVIMVLATRLLLPW